MKLVITTEPNDIHMQIIKLNAISGGQYVKIWKDNKKSTGQYQLGSNFNLPTIGNNKNEITFWVEGIAAHNAQRQTVLELEIVSNAVVCETDKVAITIIGVGQIDWRGISNGYAPGAI
jgi:hypothetical protein